MLNKSLIIADLDGTLIDSLDANIHAYSSACKALGLAFSEQVYRDNYGHRIDSFVEEMVGLKRTSIPLDELKKRKADIYSHSLHLIRVNSGLITLLNLLRNGGAKIALATSASRVNVTPTLAHCKIGELFDLIVTGDDVARPKPNPECFLRCLDHFGLMKENALIFEDSASGIKAAAAAGIDFIKVSL